LEYSFTNFVTIDSAGRQFGAVKFDTAPPEFWEDTKLLEEGVWTCTANWAHRILLFQPVFPSTILFRRALLQRVGPCNAALSRTPSEDLEFALRCLRNTRAAAIGEPLVRIRKHTSNKSGDKLKTLCGQVKILTHVLGNHTMDDAEREEIERQIRRRNRMAADEAFATLQLPLMREIAHGDPTMLLRGRRSLKYAVTLLPAPLGARLASVLVNRNEPARAGVAAEAVPAKAMAKGAGR
jgi:hypothetical protein